VFSTGWFETSANEDGGQCGCDFGERYAEHYEKGFRSSRVVGMSSATVG
jgi:hypothetical protein